MFGLFKKATNYISKTAQKVVFNSNPHKLSRDEESAFWSQANSLSANGWITPEMRRTWRNRARLEYNCNSYARGLVLTLGDVCIGTGGRLQLLTEDEGYNSQVEQEFAAWSEAINLGEKLQTMRKAKCVDGEAFAVIVNNPQVNHSVKIDLKIVECDRVSTPFPSLFQKVDGIHFDKYGNPVSYDVLRDHPGDTSAYSFGEYDSVPADFMLHWYRQDRSEQSRGLTELLPSLPLFAQLRRYTLSVIAAAEVASNLAGILHTDQMEDGKPEVAEDKFLRMERDMISIMPQGWDFSQLKAEQPTTTYPMFKREILSEIGRCLQIPVNIVLGDSSRFNYASGRLDHQTFLKNIRNEQNQCEKAVLFRLLEIWHPEAVRVGVVKAVNIPQISSQYARFYWDGIEHVDPIKEANAATAKIDAGISNLSIECAKLGYDWEDVLAQAAREQKRMKELGLLVKPKNNENKKESNDKEE
jgi:lambda family phage portal protein